ncbi:alpha-rhamnosidase, partial [bacterium]
KSIRDAQLDNGSVSDVSPSFYSLYNDGTVWPSTYIIVPHMLYDQYGDASILTDYYDGMKKWTDHMASLLTGDIMTRNTYGDWCLPSESPTEIHNTNPKMITSGEVLSTAVFCHDAQLMARSARLLGKTEDAAKFDALAARLKDGFNRKFYKAELGYYDNGTQTSCILPLAFGMVPEENKAKVFARLVQSITVEQKNHLAVGLVGGHYLLRVLSDNGRPDLAYMLATQTSYPSWGYMVEKGATTMWELWNGDTASPDMNSANIVMLSGDLNIWLNEYLGGVRPASPGFEKIAVKPQLFPGLDWVKTGLDSLHGRIESEWRQTNGKFELNVTVPANTTATIYLPTTDLKSITEGGRELAKVAGRAPARVQGDRALVEIGSGTYRFRSNLN